MKIKTTTIALLLASIAAPALHAQETETQRFDCIADTWLREGNDDFKDGGSADKLEVRMDWNSTNGYKYFFALLGFNFEIPIGKKIESASLFFVTERKKGGNISIRPYTNNFSESSKWSDESDYFYESIQKNEISNFSLNCYSDKAITVETDDISEEYQDIEKWTNIVDVTSYVKTLSAANSRINFLLTSTSSTNTGQNCIFSKNAKDYNHGDWDISSTSLIPYLEVTFTEDINFNKISFLPVADTQIRKGSTTDYSKEVAMEIKSTSGGDRFYGLMRFELPKDILDTDIYDLNTAFLRLTCVQNKGERNMGIYDYPHGFAEKTSYENEETYVDEALAVDPIQEFSLKGLGTMAMGDDKTNGSWSDYTTAESWSNNIDLSDYLKGKIEKGSESFNILIKKQKEHNDAMKIATKEATDITNAATNIAGIDAFTFNKEDLWPQLTIGYTKKAFVGQINATCEAESVEDGIIEDGHDYTFKKDDNKVITFSAKNANKIIVSCDGQEDTPAVENGIIKWAPAGYVIFNNKKITVTASDDTTGEYVETTFSFYLTVEKQIDSEEDKSTPSHPLLLDRTKDGTIKLVSGSNHDVYYDVYILPKDKAGFIEKGILKAPAERVGDDDSEHQGSFKSENGSDHVKEIIDNEDGTKTHVLQISSLVQDAGDSTITSLDDIEDDKILLLSTYACNPNLNHETAEAHSPTIVYAIQKDGTPTSLESVSVEMDGTVEYYDMQGRRVVNPEMGVYIKRQGSNVTKVVL